MVRGDNQTGFHSWRLVPGERFIIIAECGLSLSKPECRSLRQAQGAFTFNRVSNPMPIYEYLCQACQNRVGIQQSYAEYGVKKVACPLCGSKNLKRLINRVRIAKSEDQRLEAMADPSMFGDVDENDPKSVARAMKKMGQNLGEDLPPE